MKLFLAPASCSLFEAASAWLIAGFHEDVSASESARSPAKMRGCISRGLNCKHFPRDQSEPRFPTFRKTANVLAQLSSPPDGALRALPSGAPQGAPYRKEPCPGPSPRPRRWVPARLPEARELHTALDHSRCMIPCSLTLSLGPRSIRSSRLSLTRARALAAAMLSLSWQRGLTYLDLYKEAERGMYPLSWGDLFPHDDKRTLVFVAEPIERIAQEEWSQHAKFWEIQQRAPTGSSRVTNGNVTLDYAQLVSGCRYRKARELRLEKLRHYGMLVCRATFRPLTMREHLPENLLWWTSSPRLPPGIVELVDEFLNG